MKYRKDWKNKLEYITGRTGRINQITFQEGLEGKEGQTRLYNRKDWNTEYIIGRAGRGRKNKPEYIIRKVCKVRMRGRE